MGQYLPEGRIFETAENQAYISNIDTLAQAMQEKRILEGLVLRCNRSRSLIVKLGDRTGTILRQEAALGLAEGDIKEFSVLARVGKPVAFRVIALEANNGLLTPILSRKAAQEEALAHLKARSSGTVIPATVTHLEQFGAFVDVGCGLISMIPLSRISSSRIPHPNCRFQVGQEIPVVYLGYDEESKHILLSHKELLGTWEENAAAFEEGETVPGIVRGIKDYGVFVELTPNLTGLCEFREGLKEDQLVSVYIKSILPDRHKIKLNIIDTIDKQSHFSPFQYPELPEQVIPWED